MSQDTTMVEKPTSKKDLRKTISEKIETALAEYKGSFKEKRFAANVKKASRLFANDLEKGMKKKKDKNKKKKNKIKAEILNATNGVV